MGMSGWPADSVLIESVSVPISVLDADFRVLFVNSAFEREFGYARDEAVGLSQIWLLEPDLREQFSSRLKLLAIQEQPTTTEQVRIRTRLGVPVRVSLHIAGYERDTKRHYTATYADIEHPLDGVPFSSAEIYRLAIEDSPLAMSIQDADYRIIAVNKAYCELSGYCADELIGQDPAALLHPPELHAALSTQRESITDACRSDDNIVLVREMLARDGSRVRYRVAFRRTEDRHGAPIYVATLMGMDALETTQNKRDEYQRLSREAIARFDTFASLSTDAIVVFDGRDGTVSQVNPAVEHILGMHPNELIGKHRERLMRFVCAPDRQQALDLLDHHPESEQADCVVRIKIPAGVTKSVRLRIVETGQIRERFLLAEDITSRLEREAERRRAEERQRDALVHEVHHRIKNGLHSVAAMLEHARDTGAVVEDALTTAMNRVEAIAQVHGLLINDPQLIPFDQMGDVLLASIEASYDVDIEAEFIVKTDKNWLITEKESVPVALVLNELMTNAVKYCRPGGVVRAQFSALADRVEIRITNPGQLAATQTGSSRRRAAGLELVHALLPSSHAELSLSQQGDEVVAWISLCPPIIKADNREWCAAA